MILCEKATCTLHIWVRVIMCIVSMTLLKQKHLKNNTKLKITTALIPLYIADFDSYPLELLVSCSLKSYLSAFTYSRSMKQASVTTVQIHSTKI